MRWVPSHSPCTLPEPSADGELQWISTCPCGWRSSAYSDEYGADMAGLKHDDGSGHEEADSDA